MLTIKHIEQRSETSLCLYFGDEINTQLALEISQFADLLRLQLDALTEVVPSYTTLFIQFHSIKTSSQSLEIAIRKHLLQFTPTANAPVTIQLPTYYHPDVGPDLLYLAKQQQLSIDEIIKLHTAAHYTVTSLGFAPGFAYLAGLPEQLATPRHAQPKTVKKGSLGIADHQTAVYPTTSPGGWSIIGNCPLSLFDLDASPITPFTIGARVKFTSISRDEYLALGGIIEGEAR